MGKIPLCVVKRNRLTAEDLLLNHIILPLEIEIANFFFILALCFETGFVCAFVLAVMELLLVD